MGSQVPCRGPIMGPPKIPRPFGALPYSTMWWSESENSSDDDDEERTMGHYYKIEIGDKDEEYNMSLEEYYALQEAANKTCFHKLTHCFLVFKRLIFGYSS
ncbi:unnamed protein product [Citrullus colocynthis]|uniref:Uncharacterized protein n=1 Tax=Citrullus colocynthis TaxID=252529 RepID=A0ABP0XU82_9ROSI